MAREFGHKCGWLPVMGGWCRHGHQGGIRPRNVGHDLACSPFEPTAREGGVSIVAVHRMPFFGALALGFGRDSSPLFNIMKRVSESAVFGAQSRTAGCASRIGGWKAHA